MKKRNVYILLTLFCLITIIALYSFFYVAPQSTKEFKWNIDANAIVKSPQARILFLLTSIYLSLICIGLVNIVIFFIRKLRKQPLLQRGTEENKFLLSEEKTSKLIFYATAFVLLIQLLQIFIYIYKITINAIGLALFLNLTLEVGISFIVIKYLSSHWLRFNCTKSNLKTLLTAYTVVLPLIICTALLNNFILKKIGILPALNPAITIFLHLKSKSLIVLLFSQIVLFGPLAEELFFRGFIYKLIRTKFTFIAAAAGTSLFFAILHRTPQDILPLFLVSAALCYIYEKTQNILSPIIFHSIFNTFNFSLLFLLKDFIKI